MRFPYTKLPHAEPRPYLNVLLRHGFRTSNIVKAVVDSGADYSLFPMETAQHYLKLDLTQAETWTFSGTTGQTQIAKLAQILMTVLDSEMKQVWEVSTICAFCDTFEMPGALLGQNGFFSRFKTAFYQPEQYFSIRRWPIAS